MVLIEESKPQNTRSFRAKVHITWVGGTLGPAQDTPSCRVSVHSPPDSRPLLGRAMRREEGCRGCEDVARGRRARASVGEWTRATTRQRSTPSWELLQCSPQSMGLSENREMELIGSEDELLRNCFLKKQNAVCTFINQEHLKIREDGGVVFVALNA